MNIAEILRRQANQHPEDIAISDVFRRRNRDLTYAGLENASACAASLLHSKGLKPNDHVLIFVPMSAELYIALTAVFRLGLIATFLDPSAGREHIENCCNLVAPQAFIGIARAHLLRLMSPALRRIPHKFSTDFSVPAALRLQHPAQLQRQAHFEIKPCAEEAPALVTFTSGSTGKAKALVRTHNFLLQQHQVLEKNLNLAAGDKELCALPIFVLANLASGVTSIIPDADLRRPGLVDAKKIISQIAMQSPTRAAGPPAFFERLCEYSESNRVTCPTVKAVYTGGAPVTPRLMERLRRVVPNADVVAVYGSTEAEPIAHVAHHEISAADRAGMRNVKGLLAGLPVPEIELRIVPDRWGTPFSSYNAAEFAELSLPAGASGEVVVSGSHVLGSYLHKQHDDETKFKVDGMVWHRTGDAGYLDERGRLWLLGRCAARLQDERGVLYPLPVECAVQEIPGIRRAAFVAHRQRRTLVIEPVEPNSFSSPDETLEELKKMLDWARIDDIVTVRRLPVDKRHNSKTDYPVLQRLLEMRK